MTTTAIAPSRSARRSAVGGRASISRPYSLTGRLASATVRQDRKGKDYVTFSLVRGEDATSCVAFGDAAVALMMEFAVGDAVVLRGVYETRAFTTSDGVERVTKRFVVHGSRLPGAERDEDALQAA